MNMQDTISDMLTRIRNAQIAYMETVLIPSSKIKLEIARILKEEGYILYYENDKTNIKIKLKYFKGKPVIEKIQRISKPSLRIYQGKDKLKKVANGLGIAIISTSKGVMTSYEARKKGIGGEVICTVS
ncbi:30S ribosomal protein S8 [Candidatus Portiera aleyrodidarum]|uniref:Small ribosomal subunit protein uS8 n=1 Tax=Candidatus Portiera aleyrodidarum TV TaxID=1297582 RepID=A0A8D3XAX1_9GAMM|nr:30S ribosomal protein S8 [Candidatus Portiera aleyrodidarum]AGI27114.1 ribosomal protein S8 [Candidatus Portiera aleyrodidarum TV]CEI59083.1 30S ribosomal protein S8 [Candidatus Portiera aleyrodidarum]